MLYFWQSVVLSYRPGKFQMFSDNLMWFMVHVYIVKESTLVGNYFLANKDILYNTRNTDSTLYSTYATKMYSVWILRAIVVLKYWIQLQ